MTKFSESIVGKIKGDHIAPVPRWHFLLRSYVFWTLFVFSVFLGSLSFGVIVHIVNSGDLDLLNHLQGNVVTSAVMLLPYFWLLFLILFATVAYVNWKHTKLGYRFKRRWIVLGSVLMSAFFGSIFYVLGMAQEVDNLMIKSIPLYNQSKNQARIELWQQPDKGMLIGKIVDMTNNESNLVVEDGSGTDWNVVADIKNKTKGQIQEIKKKGAIVKIVGDMKGKNDFVAKDVRSCLDCDGGDDDFGGASVDGDRD